MIRAGVRALREMVTLTRGLRNLRVMAAASVVGTLGAGLLGPVLPTFLEARGLDLTRIGLVFTLGSLLPMVLAPALGALSDRFDRRAIVIGTSLVTSLLIAVFAIAPGPMLLAIALAAKLTLDRSASPVSLALVSDFAPDARRATVFGLLSSASNLMFVVALVASSVTVRALGVQGTFFLTGGLFLASSVMLFALHDTPRPTRERQARPSGAHIVRDGLLAPLVQARLAPALFSYQFLFAFALELFPIYLPLFARERGASDAMVGPLIAASWFVYALVQPAGGRLSDRGTHRKGLIAFGLAGMSACGAVLAFSQALPPPYGLAVMALGWIAMAVPDGLFRPSSDALSVDLAAPDERGRFLGALGSATALANVVAPLVYGIVATRFGLGAAFGLSAAALFAAFVAVGGVKEPARKPDLSAAGLEAG